MSNSAVPRSAQNWNPEVRATAVSHTSALGAPNPHVDVAMREQIERSITFQLVDALTAKLFGVFEAFATASNRHEDYTNFSYLHVKNRTMEALGVAAGVVGVVGPALHGVRLLVDDIRKIANAPEVLTSLKDELLAVEKALESLRAVSDSQWESLGDTVVAQAKTAIKSCALSCDKFRAALSRWTRHSDVTNGKLSWLDRTTVGFFKESQLKSMTEQVEKCKTTLTWVASVATL
jgi:hypothetical protein